MEQAVTIISVVFGFLGGGGAFITAMMYRKQERRLKNAEVVAKEVDTLRNALDAIKEQIPFLMGQIADLQKLVYSKDAYIGQLNESNHVLNIKHAKNKYAINRAYDCRHCDDSAQQPGSRKVTCPVLVQKAANDKEYLDSVNNVK